MSRQPVTPRLSRHLLPAVPDGHRAGAGVRESVLALMLGASLSTGGVLVVVLLSRVVPTLTDLLLGGAGLLMARRGSSPPASPGAERR